MVRTVFLALSAVIFLAGCGSGSDNAPAPDTSTTPNETSAAAPAPEGGATMASYAEVQAIFDKSCVQCHGAGSPKEGIDLRSYESVMKGGDEGPVVVAGDPSGSLLVKALRGNGAKQMPFMQSALPEEEIAKVEAWIKDGAKQ
ncbi:MAG: c-type cytochrome [Fimbriimonadaceae bacterium]|nr:c-type cytochrome [Chthonomonadaceae bacterium]MCO5297653.1 c-type cytochrome [Fimbriimonadaceae bacterium]